MNHDDFSNGMVLLLRYITASYVFQENHSLDLYFQVQSMDSGKFIPTLIHDYVLKEVLPMGVEAEEIQMNSLTSVLRDWMKACEVNFCFQLNIYHVSNSQERLVCLKYPSSVQEDSRGVDSSEETLESLLLLKGMERFNACISLLFRPGHYDSIIYAPKK